MTYVFILETMECDWDCDKIVRGIFSDAQEAVEYVKSNYYLLDSERDICIPDYQIKGDVFHQYGYEVHPQDMLEDEEGLFYYSQYDEGEEECKEYVCNRTSFTIRGIILDGLLD